MKAPTHQGFEEIAAGGVEVDKHAPSNIYGGSISISCAPNVLGIMPFFFRAFHMLPITFTVENVHLHVVCICMQHAYAYCY